jgi:hypothetical protein
MRAALALIAPAALVLSGCSRDSRPDDDLSQIRPPQPIRVGDAAEAVSTSHIPTLDPATMTSAEISRLLGPGDHCVFRYTSGGKPVLAVRSSPGAAAIGVIKLNGVLAPLRSEALGQRRLAFTSQPVRLELELLEGGDFDTRGELREAELRFLVGKALEAGYRGYYGCPDG